MKTMRTNYKSFEAELDAIRDRHYEATKHMTPQEHTAYINRRADEIARKHGLKLGADSKRSENVPHRPK
jgi:hypothetical protein